MTILPMSVKGATQAKLILKPGSAIIKVPAHLEKKEQLELIEKLTKIANDNANTRQYLKLYYKIGTPFLFLNRKIDNTRKETVSVYAYADL